MNSAPSRNASWCAFVTDVEGNWEYFQRYINQSKALYWKGSVLELRDDTEFVFGGDSQDKGAGDIRVANTLVDLKRRYPTRVHLIIGNRDTNKLRFATELSESALKDPKILHDKSFPYWVKPENRVWPAKYLEKHGLQDTAANRLKWMLKETMGSEGAFERRQFELKELGKPHSEEDVVSSYCASVQPSHPDNFMLRYMQHAQLGYIFGKTMFVHGGVTAQNVGRVPGQKTPVKDVRQWVEILNAWAKSELEKYIEGYGEAGQAQLPPSQRAGHALMDYCVPGGNEGATVVYTGYMHNGLPSSEGKEVTDYLLAGGVNTVAVGHQPVGDCPGVIRSPVTVVNGDSSYAASQRLGTPIQRAWGTDNRGDRCVCEILFHRETGEVKVRGILADGTPFEYSIGESGDPLVGRVTSGQWIKASMKAANEPNYLLAKPGHGHDIKHSVVPASQISV